MMWNVLSGPRKTTILFLKEVCNYYLDETRTIVDSQVTVTSDSTFNGPKLTETFPFLCDKENILIFRKCFGNILR